MTQKVYLKKLGTYLNLIPFLNGVMNMFVRLIFTFFFLSLSLFADAKENKILYPLEKELIDVVIVTHPKDQVTLDLCIDGIKKNCKNVGRVIIVSSQNLTPKAEWYDESLFPFTKKDIADAVIRNDPKLIKDFARENGRLSGWYYQQCLKLYAPFVIPNISSNVLIIDSDTIFLNPVKFLNKSNGGLFCFNNKGEAKNAYFGHAERLVPGYKRIYPNVYSVCHHMLFQRPILADLFQTVESHHGLPFWKAFCNCVDAKARRRGASEYEIYFNFALRHTDQVELRELKWTNCGDITKRDDFRLKKYHYVSFHTYLAKDQRNKPEGGNH